MKIAQLIRNTASEGPGKRFAIWVQGCLLRCPGCCNPEMLERDGGEEWEVDKLVECILSTSDIEGITLMGGEPFLQAKACTELCVRIRSKGLSVMVFSGYTLAELTSKPDWAAFLSQIDLLVDGRYRQDQPEKHRRWIGSANQVLHFLSDKYDPANPVFTKPNTFELKFDGKSLMVNGWPIGDEL